MGTTAKPVPVRRSPKSAAEKRNAAQAAMSTKAAPASDWPEPPAPPVRKPTPIQTVGEVTPAKVAKNTKKAEKAAKVKAEPKTVQITADGKTWDVYFNRKGVPTGKGLPCLFTGEPTITANARFLSGGDAKLKSVIQKVMAGEAKLSEIPALCRAYMTIAPLVGWAMEKGKLVKVAGEETETEE